MDKPAQTEIIQDEGKRTRLMDIYPRLRVGGSLIIVRERPSRTWKWRLGKCLLFTVTLPLSMLIFMGQGAVEAWKTVLDAYYRPNAERVLDAYYRAKADLSPEAETTTARFINLIHNRELRRGTGYWTKR